MGFIEEVATKSVTAVFPFFSSMNHYLRFIEKGLFVPFTDWRLPFTGSTGNRTARILAITLPIVAAILAAVVICLYLWRRKSKPARKASLSCKSFFFTKHASPFLFTNDSGLI